MLCCVFYELLGNSTNEERGMLEQGAVVLQRTVLAQHDDGRRESGGGALMIIGDDGADNEDEADAAHQEMEEDSFPHPLMGDKVLQDLVSGDGA